METEPMGMGAKSVEMEWGWGQEPRALVPVQLSRPSLAPASCTTGRSLLSAAVGEVLSFTYLTKLNRNRTKRRYRGF